MDAGAFSGGGSGPHLAPARSVRGRAAQRGRRSFRPPQADPGQPAEARSGRRAFSEPGRRRRRTLLRRSRNGKGGMSSVFRDAETRDIGGDEWARCSRCERTGKSEHELETAAESHADGVNSERTTHCADRPPGETVLRARRSRTRSGAVVRGSQTVRRSRSTLADFHSARFIGILAVLSKESDSVGDAMSDFIE